MSDFHDRFTDALADGFDSHDAGQIANGRKLDPEPDLDAAYEAWEYRLQRDMLRGMDMIWGAVEESVVTKSEPSRKVEGKL